MVNTHNRASYSVLFSAFFKIGLFSFGGGYGMVSLTEQIVVDRYKWITSSEMLDVLAIAESTPGPIAVNTATFVGCKTRGFLGGLVATLGTVLPSFMIIFALSFFFEQFKENEYVAAAFRGIRIAVVVLILSAVWSFFKRGRKNALSIFIMTAVFIVSAFADIQTMWLLLGAAIIGIIGYRNSNIIDKTEDELHAEVNTDDLF